MSRAAGFSKSISGFDPRSITGCQLWLDAADSRATGTSTNNATVSTWLDKSANGYSGTSSGSPTLVTGSQNGLPCVNFVAASSQYFNFGNIIPLTTAGITVFAVGKTTFVGSSQSLIVKLRAASGAGGRWGLFYESPNLQFLIDPTGTNPRATALATYYVGVFSLFGGAWIDPTAFLYANGTQIGSVSASGTPSSASDSLFVGAYPNSLGTTPPVSGYYFNGTIGEIIVYNTTLTASQRQKVEGYLAWKWGIQTKSTRNLVAGHSFYYIKPFTRIFQPYDIGSPFLWFDAADRKTIVGTSAVTSWTSKGSVTAVAGSAVGAPVSGTYRQNGLNTIFFPANSSLRYTIAQPNQARAWFAVYQTAQVTLNTSPGLTQYYSLINQTTGNGQQGIGGPGSPTNTATASYGLGMGASGIATYINSAVASNGANVHSVYALVNSAVSTNLNFVTQNGNSLTLNYNALATSYQTSSATYTIGDGFPYGTFSYIAEILCYNYEITVSQRQEIEGYLAHKWGLTTSYPAAHPYKKFPPSSAIPFLPTNFSGCALWLDAADPDGTGIVPANNTTLSTWRDKSANGYSGTSSGSPLLVTRSQNGLPCVNFGAVSSQYFNFGNIIPLTTAGITVFVVGKTTFAASAQSLIAKSRAAGFNGRWGLLYESPNLEFLIDVTGSGALATSSPNAYSGVFSLFGGAWSSPTAFLYANGTQIGSVSASGTPSSISDSLFVGAYPSSSGGTPPTSGYYYNGTIGEIIVYNVVLSTEQRQKVEGYLACKWGLRSSLISTHPYKLYEPSQEGFLIVSAPGTPTGLTASNTTSTFNMSWTTGSGGTPVTFTVTVYAGATLVATQTISFPTTSSTFSPMSSGVGYTFYVSATNTAGTSAIAGPSSPSVTYTAPATVLITTVGAGNVVFGVGGTTLVIECWGGGGGSMGQDSQTGAGAGGAYAKTTVTGLSSSGFTLYYSVGAGGTGSSGSGTAGGSTWGRVGTNAQPTSVTDGALAVGGNGSGVAGPNNSTQSASSIGQTKYIGGAGGYNGPENGGGGSASSGGNGSSATGGQGTAGGASGTGGGAGGSAGGTANSGGDGISNVEGGGGGGGSYNNQGGNGGLPGGAGGMGWSTGGTPTSGVNTNPHGYGGNGGRGQLRYARS
jgi:hypothetical protein